MVDSDLVASLSEEQRQVLIHMTDGTALVYGFKYIASDTGFPYQFVRRTVRHLYKLGIAERGHLICEEDGLLAGYGYWLNDSGARIKSYINTNRDWLIPRYYPQKDRLRKNE